VLVREVELETQTGTAYTLDWSPDGETLAAASGYEITLLRRGLTEIRAVLRPEGGALALTWNPGATQFATVFGFRHPTIVVWDWDSGSGELTRSKEIQAGSDQYGAFWSPDGRLLATLADDDKTTLQIWDTATWTQLRKYELSYTHPLRTWNWSSDSSSLYGAGGSDGQVVVFALDIGDGSLQEIVKLPEAAVLAFSPDAEKLAVGDARGGIEILDLPSGETLTGFQSVDQPVDMDWNPDGSTLAILDYKTRLQLWDVAP
jgi:WD40 repeat protein